MVEFNKLKITPDGRNLEIDVSVKDLPYFEDVELDRIELYNQDNYNSNKPFHTIQIGNLPTTKPVYPPVFSEEPESFFITEDSLGHSVLFPDTFHFEFNGKIYTYRNFMFEDNGKPIYSITGILLPPPPESGKLCSFKVTSYSGDTIEGLKESTVILETTPPTEVDTWITTSILEPFYNKEVHLGNYLIELTKSYYPEIPSFIPKNALAIGKILGDEEGINFYKPVYDLYKIGEEDIPNNENEDDIIRGKDYLKEAGDSITVLQYTPPSQASGNFWIDMYCAEDIFFIINDKEISIFNIDLSGAENFYNPKYKHFYSSFQYTDENGNMVTVSENTIVEIVAKVRGKIFRDIINPEHSGRFGMMPNSLGIAFSRITISALKSIMENTTIVSFLEEFEVPREDLNKSDKIKTYNTIIKDIDLLQPSFTNDLIFVKVYTKGLPSSDTPCGLDINPTIGVVSWLYPIWKKVLKTAQELKDNCIIPKHLIDFILLFKAFQTAIKTGNFVLAIKYWKRLYKKHINDRINTKCNCYG
jgi:hypothetical protein